MQRMLKLSALAGCLVLSQTTIHAESSPNAGRALAANCFQCHGTNGEAVSDMPRLAGMPAEAMLALLKKRRESEPTQHIMNVHAQGYDDTEIELIANWFAKQP